MEVSLCGKVAVVTGASSGIGLAVTRRFLECGADGVIAVDRRSPMARALSACQEEFGSRLQWIQGNVASEATAI